MNRLRLSDSYDQTTRIVEIANQEKEIVMSANDLWKDRITIDPAVLVGKPLIRGLRISVEQVLSALAAGIQPDEILQDYPDLEPEDLRGCLAYAAETIASERDFPRPAIDRPIHLPR
jgi:uncharacterized protein (DUF433 family)